MRFVKGAQETRDYVLGKHQWFDNATATNNRNAIDYVGFRCSQFATLET